MFIKPNSSVIENLNLLWIRDGIYSLTQRKSFMIYGGEKEFCVQNSSDFLKQHVEPGGANFAD